MISNKIGGGVRLADYQKETFNAGMNEGATRQPMQEVRQLAVV